MLQCCFCFTNRLNTGAEKFVTSSPATLKPHCYLQNPIMSAIGSPHRLKMKQTVNGEYVSISHHYHLVIFPGVLDTCFVLFDYLFFVFLT